MAHPATLPPLHSLDLPRENIQLPSIHELFHDLNELTDRYTIPYSSWPCQPSTSSRSSVPDTCLRPCTNVPTLIPLSSTTYPIRTIRLIYTTFENADVVVLVTPPSDPNMPPRQPLLVVGPALQRLRRRECKLERGTVMHPYRIVRNPADRPPLPTPVNTRT